MTVTDGDVAVLARQAVDLLDPTVEVSIEPADGADPYRWGTAAWVVWPLLDGRRSFGIRLESSEDSVDVLARMIDRLSEYSSESERFWGQPFPACPGHVHPATVSVDRDTVVLTCPDTGREVGRIRPDTAP